MQSTSLPYLAPRRHALMAGLAVSLLVHALLLFYLRLPTATQAAPDTRRWTQLLTVRLLPPPPQAAAAPAPPAPTPERPTRRRGTTPAPITTTPRPAPAPADTIAPPAETAVADKAPQAQPQVDLNAARATARALAKDLPTSDNWAADKLARQKALEETESERLGKNIARSARPDCRNGQGGLLAPLIWLMDKKDSGCKF
jgi:hypothetical protein